MLFVCHSSLDRDSIVKPLLSYLYSFGIDIWYDHKKLFLSDKIPLDIYQKGILESSDILIVYSKNLTQHSVCGRNELEYIYANCSDKNIYPIIYNASLDDFTGRDLDILKNTIHYNINPSNIYQVAVQISIRLMKNFLANKGFSNLEIEQIATNEFVSLYSIIPAFRLREKLVALLMYFMPRFYKGKFEKIPFIKINTIIGYYESLLRLDSDITENDLRLLELLIIWISID